MSGVLGRGYEKIDISSITSAIDPLSIADPETLSLDEGIFVVSSLKNTPLRGPRHYEDSLYAACFSGDLIDAQTVPWGDVTCIIREGNYKKFSEYNGFFAFALFDKEKKDFYIVSDNFSLHPLYYYIKNEYVVFSTSISTFCRLKDPPVININWLYEYLYFSHPMSEATILKSVYRMPPASILKYELKNSEISLIEYGKRFQRAEKPLKGKDALEKALSVFEERVPKYFGCSDKFAHALTGGYDTRTVLSFVPEEMRDRMITYTYGLIGSDDLIEALMIAKAANLPHMEICFEDEFLNQLPDLIYETTYISDGLENINRSYLPYVYRILTDNGQRFPIIISGIAADAIFRGHAPSPHYISYDMKQVFTKGEKFIDKEFFGQVFGDGFDDFSQYIDRVLDGMQDRYGEFGSLRTFFSFMLAKLLPRHFDGEASVAGNFGAFRIPFLDQDLIQLSCDIEY
ncbi:MAG: hypothetical protein KAX38_05115, partial [Candidatus Krumholzibacteria bacterium]|nr:hypothetical protein [Candidatus Krumholzibacteria bacterium]